MVGTQKCEKDFDKTGGFDADANVEMKFAIDFCPIDIGFQQ
jgi:hypothetical protein